MEQMSACVMLKASIAPRGQANEIKNSGGDNNKLIDDKFVVPPIGWRLFVGSGLCIESAEKGSHLNNGVSFNNWQDDDGFTMSTMQIAIMKICTPCKFRCILRE